MSQELKDFLPHIAAMLVGGLTPTIGLTLLARSVRGRAGLASLRPVGMAAVAVIAVAIGGGAVYWIAGRVLDATDGALTFPAPLSLLAFGFAMGLPLALPAVLLGWNDERAKAAARSKKRDWVPSKDDRRAYAKDLEKQIRDLSSPPRDVKVTIGGDGDRVLLIRGGLEAREGERLTKALSADLREHGFKRVEGSGGKRDWWARP